MTIDRIAAIAVKHPAVVAVGRHYGLQIHVCVSADPASKGGSERTVKIRSGARPRPVQISWPRPSRFRVRERPDLVAVTIQIHLSLDSRELRSSVRLPRATRGSGPRDRGAKVSADPMAGASLALSLQPELAELHGQRAEVVRRLIDGRHSRLAHTDTP